MTRLLIFPLFIVSLQACSCSEEPEPGSSDAASERPDVINPGPGEECRYALPVDLIWVIDNSHSMREEQVSLAANFPSLIDMLANPPDNDRDGMPDWPALTDLRVAVLSTDLGVGESDVVGCDASGDDGLFITASRSMEPPCAGFSLTDTPWLSFQVDDAAAFNQGFACLAQLGTTGCGLEQQLEASHRALTTHLAAGGPHEGFFRSNSVVSVIFVTDEDDCSATDTAFYDGSPSAVATLGRLSTRCSQHPDRLHALNRYIQTFRNLELDRRGDVMVSAITGVPHDLVRDPNDIDYGALLADERMQFRIDPDNEARLIPACEYGGVGSASPARRIVEVVRPFAEDDNGLVQSICQPDLRPAMEAIGRSIGGRLCPPPI